ncbi:pyridoxal-phosphate dependent enzyme [Thermopolyspora sp. NPDC052614]|uniref:pyridoxal-phosphate dependent enzyme n=1 Tax=Thermopolyspora sp. NPDC052614 TaxID=3155682 RepID=UPI00343BF96F
MTKTNLAPASPAQARHPYSPVRETEGGLVYISGQLGVADGRIVAGGVAAETRQALANLHGRLTSAGLDFRDLVKITVYLASMDDRNAMDAVYQETLPEPLPARTCIAVAELPYRARVELDAIAARGPAASRPRLRDTTTMPARTPTDAPTDASAGTPASTPADAPTSTPAGTPAAAAGTLSDLAVTVRDIRAARARIAGEVLRTPLLPAPWAPGDLWLKAESLQPTGAFKLRGAMNAIGLLAPDARARGVVTHSSGNHGQAVAWAARAAGVPAVIVMPLGAAAVKVDATRALGAEVIMVPADERESAVEAVRAERGMAPVPPFDHADVIAGQGTLALEMIEDLDAIDTVLVPVGGGGLISGVGVAVASLSPRTRIVGVEPEPAADARDSLASGRRVAWDSAATRGTIADGTRSPVVGEITFPIMRATVDEIVTVREDEILAAVGILARRARLVAEPSGALGVAAHLADPGRYGRAVAVLSGGNIDPAVLARALAPPFAETSPT